MTLGIGLVGLGWHGARYADHLVRGDVPGLSLAAVMRRDRAQGEARARELGCRFHASVHDLIADPAVHAVAIVSPAEAHAEHLRAALRSGKPVLVEKPLTLSLADAQILVQEAGSARVMVAHTLRWEPVYEAANRLLPEIGKVESVRVSFRRGDFEARPTSESRACGFHRALFAVGVHYLDWAGLLFPQGIERARCLATRADGLDALALLEARGGGRLMLDVQLHGASNDELFHVWGERGLLVGSRTAHTLELLGTARPGPRELPPRAPTVARALASFRDFLSGKIANPVTLDEATRAVALAEACARSIETRAPLEIPKELP